MRHGPARLRWWRGELPVLRVLSRKVFWIIRVQVTLVDASVFIALELQIPALPILHDLHLASFMDSDAVRFGEVTHGSAKVFPSQLTEWAFD